MRGNHSDQAQLRLLAGVQRRGASLLAGYQMVALQLRLAAAGCRCRLPRGPSQVQEGDVAVDLARSAGSQRGELRISACRGFGLWQAQYCNKVPKVPTGTHVFLQYTQAGCLLQGLRHPWTHVRPAS